MSLRIESLVPPKKELVGIVEKYRGRHGVTIPLLADVQSVCGYLPKDALEYVSGQLDIPLAELFGVATFYAMFRMQPEGKFVVRVCKGTACHILGAEKIGEAVTSHLRVGEGETTEDGMFTLQFVACLGCCSLAPAMMVGKEVHGRLTPEKVISVVESYRSRVEVQ